jgi:hypothetical protein
MSQKDGFKVPEIVPSISIQIFHLRDFDKYTVLCQYLMSEAFPEPVETKGKTIARVHMMYVHNVFVENCCSKRIARRSIAQSQEGLGI